MMTFFIKTFGCRLNQAEAARWTAELEEAGWRSVPEQDAHCLIIHSCAVTAKAEHEVVRTLRRFRERYPIAHLVLVGCAAELITSGADQIIRREDKARLSEILTGAIKSDLLTIPLHTARASLAIQDGCDRFCTYCIVPYLRGAPRSVPFQTVLDQARNLIDLGYEEIVITGCHVAAYQDGDRSIIQLLNALCSLPGKVRYRLGSVEPCTTDEKAFIDLIADHPERICRFLHIPIQSGSNTVLERMGRNYTNEHIRAVLDYAYARLPDLGLGSDFIVGFPGESEAEANATFQLLQDYPFSAAHIFPYSRRPGTPAAVAPNQISSTIITQRAKHLRELAAYKRETFTQSLIGKPQIVLIENGYRGWNEQHIPCLCSEGTRKRLITFTPTDVKEGVLQ